MAVVRKAERNVASVKRGDRKIPAVALSLKRVLARTLREQMRESDTSIQEVARRLGTGRTSVRRILDESNVSITLDTIARVADVVGIEIKLVARPMSPAKLNQLAARLPGTRGSRAKKIEDALVAGFYGNASSA